MKSMIHLGDDTLSKTLHVHIEVTDGFSNSLNFCQEENTRKLKQTDKC